MMRPLFLCAALLSLSALSCFGLSPHDLLPRRIQTPGFTLSKHQTHTIPIDTACRSFVLETSCALAGNHGVSTPGERAWQIEWRDGQGAPLAVTSLTWGNNNSATEGELRFARLEIDTIAATGTPVKIYSADTDKDVDLFSGQNFMACDWRDGVFRCWCGNDQAGLGGVINLPPRPASAVISATGKLTVDYVVLKLEPSLVPLLQTSWTRQQVDSVTQHAQAAKSLNPDSPNPVGIWRYLDQDIDTRYAAPAGRYSFAVVPAPSHHEGASGISYDILLLEGAPSRSLWRPLMRKGSLHPTGFADHYILEWYGEDMRPIPGDLSADLLPGILTLNFPLLHATLRFSDR